MKKKIKLLALVLLATVSVAMAQTTKPKWAEMKTFHSYMSSTFHPAEDGDFGPLKKFKDSLLDAAELWQASPIPSDFKPVETKAALEKLVTECRAIKKAVKAGMADAELFKMITRAHDTFHTITGECRKADD